MRQKLLSMLALLMLLPLWGLGGQAWGWGGSGTSSDPWLIATAADWDALATGAQGDTYSGKYFRQTADITGVTTMVGTNEKPFAGIYDGDGHSLGVSIDSNDAFTAPFRYIGGATIRHLHITGSVSGNLHTAGLVGACVSDGSPVGTNTIDDCRVSATITEKLGDGTLRAGGFIGHGYEAKNVLTGCLFDGTLNVATGSEDSYAAAFIGWSHYTTADRQSITNCLDAGQFNGFRRTALYYAYSESDYSADHAITLDRCYTSTMSYTVAQGTFVFNSITVPDGCTYTFASDPTVKFGGKDYWTTGAEVNITVPEGTPFDHWRTLTYPGVFVGDCFKASGKHLLQDVTEPVRLVIETNAIPAAETERTLWGVTYRYLSRQDYHYYFSDETVGAKGWHFENDTDPKANLLAYDANGDASEITVVTGYKESDYNDDGVQIHNDLVGDWRAHTHLAMIAPRAFNNSSALKTLYFKDTDANNYNALLPFDFEIGNEAFANCPNLTEVKMMQYTTEGTNHWEGLAPAQVTKLGDNIFLASPNAKVSTHRSVYQQYLSSTTWKPYRSRVIIYDATVEDFTEHGVKYHKFRNADETEALTNADKEQMMDNHLRIWNADYQQFSAAELLDTKDDATVYYTYVVGVDDDAIDSYDGVVRIYNDAGSYYNYKTLALGRNAIAGNEHVKTIEFYQSAGRSDNSYSDLKMVIQNGALKGCKNLKELRLFYYVEEGTDHWESLGPKDVIPGDNIFGEPTVEELETMSEAEIESAPRVPEGFKILVSTNRYQDFLNDPNWVNYIGYIEPVDFDPTGGSKTDFTRNGLTYGYITNPGGILQTSQVVSQDVSWWTAPRIALEVALTLATWGMTGGGTAAAGGATTEEIAGAQLLLQTAEENLTLLQNIHGSELLCQWLTENAGKTLTELGCQPNSLGTIIAQGAVDEGGKIVAVEYLNSVSYYMVKEGLEQGFRAGIRAQTALIAAKKAAQQAAAKAARAAILQPLLTSAVAAATTTSSYLASQAWGGSGSYNGDALNKGMRENILSNIHQVGLVGGGYVITTPSKNLLYHNYIKSVDDNLENAVIYAGFDDDGNSTTSNITMTFAPKAFQNKTNLRTISFHANEGQTSNASMAMMITIPDSAFVGCTNLTELNLLLKDNEKGTRALGPENFVLAGDSIFAGLDSLRFHILIDESRKQDFLDNESWAPLARFFKYGTAKPEVQYREYGASYAYAYEQNSIKKENKVSGHLIEHTIVTGMDSTDYYGFAQLHQGAVKLCNDIGTYNNYQLDYVQRKAFYGNPMLRTVSFTDLYGAGGIGDSYSSLDITLQDSCFAFCPNLVNIDLVYMKTDGTNKLVPLTPQQVKAGKGILDGTTAKIKMLPEQVAWFEADTTWNVYRDRFMPCIMRKTDEEVYNRLKDMRYYDPAATGTDDDLWDDFIDLARIAGVGFSWLDGRFTNNDRVRSFADFKQFESVGLDYVGGGWFNGCRNLGSISLPSTIKRIGHDALANTGLREIEIPASVTEIEQDAFLGSTSLNTIIVRGETPATLSGSNQFDKHDGLRIYVPAASIDAYKTAWSDYAQYIVSDADYKKVTHITTTAVGQVADKLGLTPVKENSKIRYLQGDYAKYDSLTVSGPLNGDDVAVLRHLMGANAWESDPTGGRLRYLNLWGATLCKDTEHSYNGYGVDEYLEKDNWVGEYMFHNCTALETLILPASVTEIGENTFQEATALKRICVGRNTTKYTRDLLQDLEGIEELVFLTDQFASSESSDPWEADIDVVYVRQSQLADYMSDPALTRRTQNVTTVFEDDQVMWVLAEGEHYFPSEYLNLESVEGIFTEENSKEIISFDEFQYFQNVKRLDATFTGCTNLSNISLPDSIEYIGYDAFRNCRHLKNIYISCDSVPEIDANAFDTQVENSYGDDDFRIYVPKDLCKRYREAWPQYAQYINVDTRRYTDDDIITVTVTEANTLAQALGLTITTDKRADGQQYISSARGDYSQYKRLKVVGPISGADLSILRYLAGYCPWTNTRNYMGKLEYLDLYDANLVKSDWTVATDAYYKWFTKYSSYKMAHISEDNTFPTYGLLQAYNLKTLILPKSCTKMDLYGLLECEGLEVLVIGDKMEDFNWSALDNDAMLTRLYILSEKKTQMTDQPWVLREFANNYNPTFDGFYVRPSLYQEYLKDQNYTQNMQRTNLISKGEFEEDESFLAFAAHGAATQDDLANVTDVTGWFQSHPGITDLTPLGYTLIDSLKTADIAPLTSLKKVTLPVTLTVLEDNVFKNATGLRYVDMLMCDSTNVIADVKARGFSRIGIDSLQTLVYLPHTYGTHDGTNLIVATTPGSSATTPGGSPSGTATLAAKTFRLVDGKDYCVPYAFTAESVVNSRSLPASAVPYTVCVPYELDVPAYARAYELTDRDGSTLTFTEVAKGTKLQAMTPYLVKVVGNKRLRKMSTTLNTSIAQTIPANGGSTFGQQVDVLGYSLRGTLSAISNAEAAELGAYILQSDGDWHPVVATTPDGSPSGTAASVLPFRAYLLPSARNAARSIGMSLVDDTTGIDTIETVDADGTRRYYDLNGRELPGKPAKGMYIYNGKKYVNK
ncbi:MAG: leucine-rich repeat domain-containing protein [Prevotella sp.]|nr:leucine-rich repeat domain-containing protein [Prevotella sp.]